MGDRARDAHARHFDATYNWNNQREVSLTRRRIHYAWIMLARCFLGLLTAYGVCLSFGAFIEPWEREFAVNRRAIAQVSLLNCVVYGVMQPIVGRLVDHYGGRRVLSLSVLLVGLGILAASFARSTSQLLVLYGLVASIGFGGASGVTASVAVTKWSRCDAVWPSPSSRQALAPASSCSWGCC
jgi:MFS family permease